jgi:hypothetical protein
MSASSPEVDEGANVSVTVPISRGILEIDGLHTVLASEDAKRRCPRPECRGITLAPFGERGGNAACRSKVETFAVIGIGETERGTAKPQPLIQHRIENRDKVAG